MRQEVTGWYQAGDCPSACLPRPATNGYSLARKLMLKWRLQTTQYVTAIKEKAGLR